VKGIGGPALPDAMFAPDFAGWSGLSGDIPGPVFRERITMIGELFPDGLSFEIFDTIAVGANVALRCRSPIRTTIIISSRSTRKVGSCAHANI
jgi:hypothetical protein